MSEGAIGTMVGAGGVAAIVSAAGTWVVWRMVGRWQILDRPNERSLHRVPVPTMGGLGIVAGFWAGMAVWRCMPGGQFVPAGLFSALGAATLVLLLVTGDNIGRPLRVWEKALLQVLATAAWLYWGPHLESLTLPGLGPVELGAWGTWLTALWLVGMCNVYNFMDGLDGMTAGQTVLVGGLLLACYVHLGSPLAMLAALLVASAAGFLVFNLPPARIFMGDVGAVFLGFAVGALGVLGEPAGFPLWLFAAVLGYYLFDTTYTLVRRAGRRENLLRAHRKHLYQRLDKLGWSHGRIDLGSLLVTLLLGGGAGAYLCWGRGLGGALMLSGAAILILTATWVERRDRDFA